MHGRTLGRSGIEVGPVGLGTEHLYRAPQETVSAVLAAALDHGVNYLDMVFGMADYRAAWATALHGRRHEAALACHLGSVEKDGQYQRSRNPQVCETFFLDFLRRFETDYVDVLMIHNFNRRQEYDAILRPNGVAELAQRYRQEGKTRAIGISGHNAETLLQAVNDGLVDVVMFPVNMSGNTVAARRELLNTCAQKGVGVVAMKVLGGGKLLQRNRTQYFPSYQTGGRSFKKKAPRSVTPVQCISYALAQSAVTTALVGVRSVAELEAAAAYMTASDEEKDFAGTVVEFEEYLTGECVYCNHCLPCPVHVDVGMVARLVDTAITPLPAHMRAEYAALPAPASACTRCGACVARCPFGVDVLVRIDQAVAVFEAG